MRIKEIPYIVGEQLGSAHLLLPCMCVLSCVKALALSHPNGDINYKSWVGKGKKQKGVSLCEDSCAIIPETGSTKLTCPCTSSASHAFCGCAWVNKFNHIKGINSYSKMLNCASSSPVRQLQTPVRSWVRENGRVTGLRWGKHTDTKWNWLASLSRLEWLLCTVTILTVWMIILGFLVNSLW